jgi:cytochrome c oxidase subunit 3
MFGAVCLMRWLHGAEFLLFGIDMAATFKFWLFAIGLLITLYTMFAWWSDTIKEANEGDHTRVVSLHLRYGMIMFIASEVMFFVAWFWAFFDASLFTNEAIQASRVAFTGGVNGRRRASKCSIPGTCRSTTRSSCCCRARRSPGRITRCCTMTARA